MGWAETESLQCASFIVNFGGVHIHPCMHDYPLLGVCQWWPWGLAMHPQQLKTFPGFNVVQLYAQMPVPQMAQVPVQMAVPSAQVQLTDQTAAMGHMREVMMQMQDVCR